MRAPLALLALAGCQRATPIKATWDFDPVVAAPFVGTWSLKSRILGDHKVVLSRNGRYRAFGRFTPEADELNPGFSGPWFIKDGALMLYQQPIDPPFEPQPTFVPDTDGRHLVAQPPFDGTLTKIK